MVRVACFSAAPESVCRAPPCPARRQAHTLPKKNHQHTAAQRTPHLRLHLHLHLRLHLHVHVHAGTCICMQMHADARRSTQMHVVRCLVRRCRPAMHAHGYLSCSERNVCGASTSQGTRPSPCTRIQQRCGPFTRTQQRCSPRRRRRIGVDSEARAPQHAQQAPHWTNRDANCL